ncbi:hypothetical protein FHS19_000947 [Paenibacillus rhizosphaerae]|uniref:Uncharacterized protein n=1 Tax=Paenibacillus rhizosphaerae TaxID=297318 RepID=A0A839TIF4_9BACL|nr:hypothetical protein [Paenibacillus rhizosphaerae]
MRQERSRNETGIKGLVVSKYLKKQTYFAGLGVRSNINAKVQFISGETAASPMIGK